MSDFDNLIPEENQPEELPFDPSELSEPEPLPIDASEPEALPLDIDEPEAEPIPPDFGAQPAPKSEDAIPSFEDIQSPASLPKQKNNKTLWIILIVALVVICCCCVGGILIGANSDIWDEIMWQLDVYIPVLTGLI